MLYTYIHIRMYGFRYHHAENEVATLLLWLPANVECKVPPFATHHVGVAGAVILPDDSSNNSNSSNGGNKVTENSKILLVRERSKQAAGWKLPGGYANLGEDFSKAAVREIWEETGIKARFDGVLTVRHSNNIQFGRDDIYVICKMQLESTSASASASSGDTTSAQKITIDAEIDDAVWMPLGQFKESTKHPMLQKVADLLLKDTKGLTETEMPSPVRGRSFKLYHP
jgi:ADP-ribose pyrophosphatase YjhB (NUDIX family)